MKKKEAWGEKMSVTLQVTCSGSWERTSNVESELCVGAGY